MDTITRKLLRPGDYYITDAPMILEVIVGSCVAVCLYNRINGTAAMNHFLLAQPTTRCAADIGRFGTTATKQIIQHLFEIDPVPTHYQGQIFGGAAVLRSSKAAENVGNLNIETARAILKDFHIKIVHEQVGGTRGRRIKFNTGNNTVHCRFTGEIRKKIVPH